MTVVLIVAGSVILAALLIAFIVWAHQYTKAGPNEVLIISGRKRKGRGGCNFPLRPCRSAHVDGCRWCCVWLLQTSVWSQVSRRP